MDRRTLINTLGLGMGAMGAMGAMPIVGSNIALSAGIDTIKLIETASHCHSIGLQCLAHCEKELATGNKSMAECLGTVLDMLAACEALQKLAARQSPFVPSMAKTCAEILLSCAKACEPHIKHMEICNKCRDACIECEKVCKSVA